MNELKLQFKSVYNYTFLFIMIIKLSDELLVNVHLNHYDPYTVIVFNNIFDYSYFLAK